VGNAHQKLLFTFFTLIICFPLPSLTLFPFHPVGFGQNLHRPQAHLDQALFCLAE
jgi:hypothetical protein